MLNKIKQLGKDTLIYGTSTVIGRLLNFILVPIYTNYLLPSEYGVTAYIFSLIAFLNVIYNYGMETAFFRYTTELNYGDTKQNFSTPFISIFFSSLLFSSVLILYTDEIAITIALPFSYREIIFYSALILFLDAIAIIPFASIRLEHKPKLFAAIKFINILINVIFNIIFLIILRKGVEGIFISQAIASAITFILLVPIIIKNLTLKFHFKLVKELLKYGIPSLPAGIAAMMLQVIDRPILRMLTNDESVGIYQANYRLAIFMMLVVSMFDFAWKPFFFSQPKNEESKILFSRIGTYFLLLMSLVLVLITTFIDYIVKINIFNRFIIHPEYWLGLKIVPIVMAGYLFNGMATIFSAGIYIEKKTYYLPIVTIISAVINLVLNFVLIPILNITGCAIATLLSYFAYAILTYIYSQKIYPIKYELIKMLKIFIATSITIGIYFYLGTDILLNKILVAIIYIFLILSLKIFKPTKN